MRSAPGLSLGFGARDCRLLVFLLGGAEVLFPTPIPPASDGLDVLPAGTAGGPIDVRVPATPARGLVMEIEGGLVFDGVPVLEVDVLEAGAVNCFVGDFVGDCTS